jgi:PhnB protein
MKLMETSSRAAITPYLCVHDAEAAIEFYKAAFGAVEEGERYPWEEKIGHAELVVAGARLCLADEFPAYNRSPQTLGGTAVMLSLNVDDVDAWTERAERHGATVEHPPTNEFYGRMSKIRDPFGHVWSLHSPVVAGG